MYPPYTQMIFQSNIDYIIRTGHYGCEAILYLTGIRQRTFYGADYRAKEDISAHDLSSRVDVVLQAIPPLAEDELRRHVVRAQYDGYRAEPQVAPDSRTETFVAMRLFVDNWRWAGVPFYLRTGKRLPRRLTEIAIEFKRAPLMLFRETPVNALNPNVLIIRIQPDEGISLSFDAKVPGPLERLDTVTMDFSYARYFKAEPSTGYETLLFDAMTGDQTLFHRMDIVEAGWQAVEPVLRAWKADAATPLPIYAPGSPGPAEAEFLLEHDRRQWRC